MRVNCLYFFCFLSFFLLNYTKKGGNFFVVVGK